jgi:hypothetical protein
MLRRQRLSVSRVGCSNFHPVVFLFFNLRLTMSPGTNFCDKNTYFYREKQKKQYLAHNISSSPFFKAIKSQVNFRPMNVRLGLNFSTHFKNFTTHFLIKMLKKNFTTHFLEYPNLRD